MPSTSARIREKFNDGEFAEQSDIEDFITEAEAETTAEAVKNDGDVELKVKVIEGDIESPEDGQVWLNTTDNKLKVQIGGSTEEIELVE